MSEESKWDEFKGWLVRKIAQLLPDSVKRHVLYELADRTKLADFWNIRLEQMYDTLRDY